MARIAFLTCHLTGTGHLVRTLALARAAASRGHTVEVLSGGRPLPHLDHGDLVLRQLPPVIVQGFEFTTLRDPTGALVEDAYMNARRETLSQILDDLRPDALVTELFPFGRRVLAAEFAHAIAAARRANPSVAVLCSVRDIPEPKPKRLEETADHLRESYDGVVVHGDAAFLPLSTTWPLPPDLAPMIHHTGYVGPGPADKRPRGREVLVAVGGGVLGRHVLEVAAEAAGLSSRPWRLLVGGSDAADVAAQTRAAHAHSNLMVEPARADYRTLLAEAACSVSLCGYNTAVELARETVPAILIPSEEAGEQEQLIRARALARHPGIDMLRTDGLTADRLASAVETRAAGSLRPRIRLTGDDGTGAIEVLEQIVLAGTTA